MLFIKSVLSSAGQVQAEDAAVSGASYVAGQAYQNGNAVCTEDAVHASDAFLAGWRYSATGQLRIVDATSALPSPAFYHSGIAVIFSMLGTILGSVSALAQQVTNYFYGSSKGSADKNTAISDAVARMTPTEPPKGP